MPGKATSNETIRILVVTHVFRRAPTAGNELRILQLVEWLARRFEVHVCLKGTSSSTQAWRPSSPSSKRVFLHEFEPWDQNPHPKTELHPELHSLEHEICPDSFATQVADLSRQLKPRAVIAEYVFMSRILKIFDSETLKLIDTHDVFSRRGRKVLAHGIQDKLALSKSLESAMLSRADALIAITNVEEASLRRLAPSAEVIQAGVAFPVRTGQRTPSDLSVPKSLIVASDNPSNRKGVEEFLSFCWPRILGLAPRARLLIAGRICERLSGNVPSGVALAGELSDLTPVYESASIALNPVKAGTGLKIKSVEALSWGLPLVAFSNGVEGLSAKGPPPWKIVRNWEDFATEAAKLFLQPEKTRAMSQAAHAFTRTRLSTDGVYLPLEKFLLSRISPSGVASPRETPGAL
jgi:hypothetical protein